LAPFISCCVLADWTGYHSFLELKELKTSDESRIFNIKLTGESEAGAIPVYQAKIDFFTTADGKSELLGSASTNRDGNATFKAEKGTRFLKDKEGTSVKTKNAKWGNHRSGFVEPSRSLWSSGAPIWMITTLIILLTGVWSHYLYAIIQLIKIRKEGKKIDQK